MKIEVIILLKDGQKKLSDKEINNRLVNLGTQVLTQVTQVL